MKPFIYINPMGSPELALGRLSFVWSRVAALFPLFGRSRGYLGRRGFYVGKLFVYWEFDR